MPASSPTHAGSVNLCHPASSQGNPTKSRIGSQKSPARGLLNRNLVKAGPFDLDVLGVRFVPKAEQDDQQQDERHPEGDRHDLTDRPFEHDPRVDEQEQEHCRKHADRHGQGAKLRHEKPPRSQLRCAVDRDGGRGTTVLRESIGAHGRTVVDTRGHARRSWLGCPDPV